MSGITGYMFDVLHAVLRTHVSVVQAVLAGVLAVALYIFAARFTGKALGARDNEGIVRIIVLLAAALLIFFVHAAVETALLPKVKIGWLFWPVRAGIPLLVLLSAVLPAAAWLLKWSYVETAGGMLLGALAAFLMLILVHTVADSLRGGLKSSEKIRGRTEGMNEQLQR